jgi:hypothetical protein
MDDWEKGQYHEKSEVDQIKWPRSQGNVTLARRGERLFV